MMARGWELAPSEIWQMTMAEFIIEFETRRPHAPTDYANGMTEGDIESIKAGSAALRDMIRETKQNDLEAA